MSETYDSKAFGTDLHWLDHQVESYGFATIVLEATPDHPPGGYTVGLTEKFGHPELSAIGAPADLVDDFLFRLASLVVAGSRIVADHDIGIDGVLFHVYQVDQTTLASEIYSDWRSYYSWRGLTALRLTAVGLVPCRERATNRTARRAVARREHRLRALR